MSEAIKACDINLELGTVLSRASIPLAQKIEYSIDLIRKSEPLALRLDPVNGFYNTFSGGKDSQVLYHLVKLAGVKAKTHMNLTSIDPSEVIRFVRTQYPDVELIKPRISIYDMAKRKKNFAYQNITLVLCYLQRNWRSWDGYPVRHQKRRIFKTETKE